MLLFFISTLPYERKKILDVHRAHLILGKVGGKIALKELTIPCLLEEEMKINLFLRADNLKGFSFLRANKDSWV